MKQYGLKPTVLAKNVGYELRCAAPIRSTGIRGTSATCIHDGRSGVLVPIANPVRRRVP